MSTKLYPIPKAVKNQKRGGKRANAGRKPRKSIKLVLYVHPDIIEANQGRANSRKIALHSLGADIKSLKTHIVHPCTRV